MESYNVIWWAGDQDPENPLFWSAWKKGRNLGIIFLITFVSPFASSVFAPAILDMMLDFREMNSYLSGFVVSVYVLGYAVGPLIISPLSEIYGRIPMYHICNILFVVFTVLCGLAQNLSTLAVFRFFAGCGGSSAFALGPASVADMIPLKRRGAMIAVLGMVYNLGPAIAPTVGSYLNDAKGWRWIFWLTSILGGVCLIASFGLSETYEPVLIRRKAARLCKQTGNENLRSRLDSNSSHRQILRSAMLRPLKLLFLAPNVLLVSFLTAVGYGYMYILYTTLPAIWTMSYTWKPKNIGLAYLGTAVGNLLGMVCGGLASDAIVKKRAAQGDTRPENRLLPMIFFWPLTTVGLIIYGWTAQKQYHWIIPLVGTAIFGMGSMSSLLFCGTHVTDVYTVHSASAAAAVTVLRCLLGGLVPLFGNKMYEKMDAGWMFTTLGLIALAFAPVPWYVYRSGEWLRLRSEVAL